LNDKKISLIIKNLPEEINVNYNKKLFNIKKKEYRETPNLIPFNYESNDSSDGLFYYNNFEIVDKSIYDLLFGINSYSSFQKIIENAL